MSKGSKDRRTQAERDKAVIYCEHDRFKDRCDKCKRKKGGER